MNTKTLLNFPCERGADIRRVHWIWVCTPPPPPHPPLSTSSCSPSPCSCGLIAAILDDCYEKQASGGALRAESPRVEAPATPGAPVHPNDCNQGLQRARTLLFSPTPWRRQRDTHKHVQQHTPTLFRMNKPEENNNNSGGSLLVSASHCRIHGWAAIQGDSQSKYTKQKQLQQPTDTPHPI